MTARTEPLDLEATLEILDGIVYGDLFDCAVGLDEVVRFSRRAVGHHEATETLASPSIGRTIVRTDEYVTLAGREELVERRRKTRARALRLRRRAERTSLVLGMVPFVRGIILTGSVAAEAATEDADIDLMIIVAPSRLAFVFLVLGGFSRLTRRCFYCPNYYISEDHLLIERQNLFIAREIAQARPLDKDAERFFEINDWVREYLPNASPSQVRRGQRRRPNGLQRLLEFPFRGRFGRWCESIASRTARKRIDEHYRGAREGQRTKIVDRFDSDHELRFHHHPELQGLRKRYADHRSRLENDLRMAIDETEAAR